jgi:hypothetical protein
LLFRTLLVRLTDDARPRQPSIARAAAERLAALSVVTDVTALLPADADSARSWDIELRLHLTDRDAPSDPGWPAAYAAISADAVVVKTWVFRAL